ncbi:hypothetical protein HZF05_01105 [Sphingomonas sp. CGMCC 1.13654]|uniref:Uncharacterized protein n=1 Tax=Sphingomonas chungangi TaxID=2683589 RepID=A0A838L012_9SPHN|nr:hypothetical protein [Sphingomonas chungangi]MBA2932681.1 hypothetical protein [Sphingomonas chungangi]MVW56303.1 hypothetical protein [Sphingomonas chungangi]
MFDIIIRYQDGREARHEGCPATINAAMSVALDTADELGHDMTAEDPRRARSVEIWEGEDMQLSITVLAGGLLSDAGVPAAR